MPMFWWIYLHVVNLFLIMVANVVYWRYLKILKERSTICFICGQKLFNRLVCESDVTCTEQLRMNID